MTDADEIDAAEAQDLSRLPERTCIVTRQAGTPETLLRFVAGPDDTLVPDLKAKLPGRGVWVTATAPMVREAMRRKLFARGLRRQVAVPGTLDGDIDALLKQSALQALSLANKAGAAVAGFTKVESRIEAGGVAAVVHASEAAPDGVRKLKQALRRTLGDAADTFPVIQLFTEDELRLAMGGAGVIHAALVAGRGSDGFLVRWRRLVRYRNVTGADSAPGGTGTAVKTVADGQNLDAGRPRGTDGGT